MVLALYNVESTETEPNSAGFEVSTTRQACKHLFQVMRSFWWGWAGLEGGDGPFPVS